MNSIIFNHFLKLLIVGFSCSSLFSQTLDEDFQLAEDCIELIILDNRIFNQTNLGFSLNFSKEIADVYDVGLYLGAHWRKFNPTSFDLINPQVINADVGIQFKSAWIKEKNYNLKSFINFTWSMSTLNDRDQIVEIGIDELEYENFGYNSFFSVIPGLEYQLRLNKTESILPLFLTFRAGYRFAFGNTEFGSIKDYAGVFYGVGVSFVTNFFQ